MATVVGAPRISLIPFFVDLSLMFPDKEHWGEAGYLSYFGIADMTDDDGREESINKQHACNSTCAHLLSFSSAVTAVNLVLVNQP